MKKIEFIFFIFFINGRRLGRNNSLPWCVSGDFNDILFAHEKQGSPPGEECRMEAFRRTLEGCQLMDIGFSGPWFTWEMGRLMDQDIRVIETSSSFFFRPLPFALWWVIENSCEEVIRKVWNESSGAFL